MRVLVVYESMYGNTETVARAVASTLAAHAGVEVDLIEVGEAPTTVDGDTDLLVLGAPTHAFGLSRDTTRADAGERGGRAGYPLVSRGIGVREWLDRVHLPDTVRTATFDTKVDRPRLPGSAARSAAKRLRRAGLPRSEAVTSFYVTGQFGPLADGEADRAREWAARLPTPQGRP